MSTRSLIAAQFDPEFNGGIVATYCHFDGYLSGVGKALLDEYNDVERAFTAANFGYLSSLAEKFEEFESKEHANSEDPDYFEDEWDLLHSAGNYSAEYVYLWKEGMWYVAKTSEIPKPGMEYTHYPLKPLATGEMIPEWKASIAYLESLLVNVKPGSPKHVEMIESIENYQKLVDQACKPESGFCH